MVKISGWVFVTVGALFSGLSSYLNFSQKSNSMTLFLYLGYLFIAYGIAKVLISFVGGKDKKERNIKKQLPEENNNRNSHYNYKDKLPNDKENDNMNNTHSHLNHTKTDVNNSIKNNKSDSNGYIGYCPKCGTPMRNINMYCHRCGTRQNQ